MDITLRDVQGVAQALLALFKGERLYHPDHPSLKELILKAITTFQTLLDKCGFVELEIGREGLKWENHVLIPMGSHEMEGVFNLYRDGVRMITFQQGLTEEELARWVGLLSSPPPPDQDFVTLLWLQHFQSIQTISLESFQAMTRSMDEENRRHLLKAMQGWYEAMEDPFWQEIPGLGEPEEEGERVPEKLDYDITSFQKAFQEADAEAMRQALDKLVALVCQESSIQDTAGKVLVGTVKSLLQELDLPMLTHLLKSLPAEGEVPQKVRESILSPEILTSLGKAATHNPHLLVQDVAFFSNELSDNGLNTFLEAYLSHPREDHPKLCELLWRFRPEALFHLLLQVPEGMARLLLDNLQDLPEAKAKDLFTQGSPQLKRLLLHRKDAPKQLILSALSSEDGELRKEALSLCIYRKIHEAYPIILQRMDQEAFWERPLEELEKWGTAAAILGREEVEPYFLSFLQRRSLLPGIKEEARMIVAAKALSVLGSQKALPYLRKASKRWTHSVLFRKACAQAVQAIEKKLSHD